MDDPISDKKLRHVFELISRLERISVDSHLAHRASGIRVALLRWFDLLDTRDGEIDIAEAAALEALIKQGYSILENAAKELRGNV